MQRVEAVRTEIQSLIRAVPFRRLVLAMENGDRALIEHPENIAFDPEPNGTPEFYVISSRLRMLSTVSAVSSVILAARDGAAA